MPVWESLSPFSCLPITKEVGGTEERDLEWKTLDQARVSPSRTSPCHSLAFPHSWHGGINKIQSGAALPQPWGIDRLVTLDFFLPSPPQPDHFVQDPAVLREKAEARRMAFLARKG